MGKTANIAFWGLDVAEMTTLIHALKTGKYEKQSASIHPFVENIKIKGVTFKATIPSGNESARRSFRPSLPDFDGIVYVADNTDSESSSMAKEDIESLLGDKAISRPILILIPTSDASGTLNEKKLVEELGVAKLVGEKGGSQVSIFAYSLSTIQHEGYQEGFEWLVKYLSQ
ncbi:hypothetical protein HYPSUDRAFT_219534 [Hypholoma sublateritium FD-334 SS-4]|uniref:ADP-ribosylation factor-like protein 1 n=1 Tax=Hypholoma sublateritium (strain FD-334 SS-4) TaxID=945553 RepID=A0A0D2KNX0_HYPSF|nr:hypothetical protein HYPSUDRAFT_219534 [Hypholoma sublateritium FD-334 SS-4]